jgi:glycosyltransferase involved in cell wall biosynthesis
MTRAVVVSINTTWNIANFRSELIRRLQAEGFRIVAISPPDMHVAALEEMGVAHVPIYIDNKGLSPLRDLRLLVDYWRILRRLRPVSYLGWTIKPNIYGSLAAHVLGIPVINNISGLGTAFIKINFLTRVVKALYRTALARSATVFFQNRHDRNLFVSQRLVSLKQADVLPGSGINLAHFTPAPMPDLRFSFLMVARLLRDKGVVEFVEAARIVRETHPDVQFHLLGAIDVQNRTAISRDMLEGWLREGVVHHLGEAADVRPHLAAASVVVLPSYREGMPRSLLEAAAMAKPLIATDVPGCTEIAREGENALLCQVRDAQSLATAMLRMLALDPAERAAMGLRGRAIAEAEFDTAVVERQYLAAIERATQSGQPS